MTPKEDQDLRKEVLSMYTPLSVAKEEIWKRWNDKNLKKKVDKFLGTLPKVPQKEPKSIITRQLASPDIEFLCFLELAKMTELKPLAWEFLEDIFITTNKDKADLARMAFFHKINGNMQPVLSYEKIIDLTGTQEKKKFRDIKTVWGENFVNFHHRLLKSIAGKVELFDASSWYKSKGRAAKEYYPYFLALFVRNGIMFENFLINKNESDFTSKVVLPAFKKVEKILGYKPLIAPIVSIDGENEQFCWSYPGLVKKFIRKNDPENINTEDNLRHRILSFPVVANLKTKYRL